MPTDRAVALMDGVQAGLGRLRGLVAASTLLARGAEELCHSCGFARSLIFSVDDERMTPAGASGDAESESVVWGAALSLAELPLESELLRRRMPLLVDDVGAMRSVGALWGSTSYVAAPVMPQGAVVGVLYADRRGQHRAVDALDRATLAAFAEGFGFAFQATVLSTRLRVQHDQVRDMLRSTEQLFDEFIAEERRRVDHADSLRAAHHTASFLEGSSSRLEQVLTPREIDVIQLLAAGETNAGVASRLAITEGTAKWHVKQILRKLRAANRAEAVSRYLRITAVDQQGESS
jgi:DNA-binding CsgD family transcriptional regulator